MNGRDIFEKHAGTIKVLVAITKKFPRRIRNWLFNVNRNRDGKISMLFRYLAVSSLAKSVGKNVAVFPGVYFENIENLEIGNNVSIHQMCYIDAEGGIVIEDDVSIAHRSTVLSSNHLYNEQDVPIKYQGMSLSKTTIKKNVWVGCGCAILAGVTINSGSIIGANSTVTKNVPENVIVAGSPAKVIKARI